MQNMISVNRGPKAYRVFFDVNREAMDFDNIAVHDERNEPVRSLQPQDIEALKDIIAQEVILAAMEATAMVKAGNVLRN